MTAEEADGEPPAGPEAGWRGGRSCREIAVDPCPGPRAGVGAERVDAEWVDAEWHRDGWMRARVRRLPIPGSLPPRSVSGAGGPPSRGDEARAAAKHEPRGE